MPILLRNPFDPGGASAFSRLVPRPLAADLAVAIAFRTPTPPVSHVSPGPHITPASRAPGSVGPPSRPSPIGAGFVPPNVLKGRITNLRTRQAYFFMFNPTEINRTDGWAWSAHRVPGASHPIVTGGTGGDRKISFSLYFDADRGRSDERRLGEGNFSLDLTTELNVWRSMTYPQDPHSNSLPDRGPARFILNYGTFFNGIEVVIDSANTSIITMTPKLQPMRAVIAMEMTEIVQSSIFSTDKQRLPADPGSTIYSDYVGDNPVVGSEIDNGSDGPGHF